MSKCKLILLLKMSSLCHEGVWGSRCINSRFLYLDTTWRWVVSFTSLPLYPRGKYPGTHWIGVWVDPRAGVDDVEKRKFLILTGLELRPLDRLARIAIPITLTWAETCVIQFPRAICNTWGSQWPRGVKHETSSPAQTLRSWVRIPFKAWMSEFILRLC
jgi:hypothetical protein